MNSPSGARPSAILPALGQFLGVLVLTGCGLSGCAGQVAGPGYGVLRPVTAEVEGVRFVLRLGPDRAEAVRTSPMLRPDFARVARLAEIAVARKSGCEPRWVVGDPSMLELGLACPGQPVPKMPRGRHVACDILSAAGQGDCG
ncbi:hypothetical protein PVT71_06940 [Salipiger sp. H15]|uniref:Lipoprotein n=1 Tax=Alloyangia sp. H15 TaxID=3029062 RepID=A0AAU8AK85_9RHOB